MAPQTDSHARSHSILLLQRLLNVRDASSPFTLVLDTLEQPAGPLLSEITLRVKTAKTKVLSLSFATLRPPQNVDIFIKAARKDLQTLRGELVSQYPLPAASRSKDRPTKRALVIIDSLNSLSSTTPDSASLVTFLSSLSTPAVSMVAVYHTDVPVVTSKSYNDYEPPPFTMLCYLATAILRLSSLPQEIERQKARNRAVQEPEWGLGEGREGAIIGLPSAASDEDQRTLIVDMELRRRSGRSIEECFLVRRARPATRPGLVSLLSDHPMFAPSQANGAHGNAAEEPESTFSLGLTEKQRRDRDGVVLPYFDAQREIGAGEGGRILYEMGREDDFDDEDDI